MTTENPGATWMLDHMMAVHGHYLGRGDGQLSQLIAQHNSIHPVDENDDEQPIFHNHLGLSDMEGLKQIRFRTPRSPKRLGVHHTFFSGEHNAHVCAGCDIDLDNDTEARAHESENALENDESEYMRHVHTPAQLKIYSDPLNFRALARHVMHAHQAPVGDVEGFVEEGTMHEHHPALSTEEMLAQGGDVSDEKPWDADHPLWKAQAEK